ncbi:hypothetical protein K2O51_33305 (plasmid) [Cupriavidus pinatubonensis]|nr:hypothetical protein K2O51_33305 [Cupriavidus pinatubonensis]
MREASKEKLLALTGVYENLPEDFPEGGCPLLNAAIEARQRKSPMTGQADIQRRRQKVGVSALAGIHFSLNGRVGRKRDLGRPCRRGNQQVVTSSRLASASESQPRLYSLRTAA